MKIKLIKNYFKVKQLPWYNAITLNLVQIPEKYFNERFYYKIHPNKCKGKIKFKERN